MRRVVSIATQPAIPRNVWTVSVTSLFSDWSYEMLLPILPFFLVYVIGASILVVGLVEGLAVFAQAVVQPLSSRLVRTARARKRGGLAGYSTTTLADGLLALTTVWPAVLVLRVTAWTGRGWRQPIKKTILSNATVSGAKGSSFGLEQSLRFSRSRSGDRRCDHSPALGRAWEVISKHLRAQRHSRPRRCPHFRHHGQGKGPRPRDVGSWCD